MYAHRSYRSYRSYFFWIKAKKWSLTIRLSSEKKSGQAKPALQQCAQLRLRTHWVCRAVPGYARAHRTNKAICPELAFVTESWNWDLVP